MNFRKLLKRLALSYNDPDEEEEYNQVRLPILREFFNVKYLLNTYLTIFPT
jgi:hypothetical protein